MTWNGIDLGGLNAIDLSKLQMLLEPVKIGSLGAMKLDDRYVGLEDGAEIAVELREVNRTKINLLHPWGPASGTSTATLELGPVPGKLLSASYGQALLLHPRDIIGTTEDITCYKTVPAEIFSLSRDGTKDDVWKIVFKVYPDVTKLSTTPPTNPYGTIG